MKYLQYCSSSCCKTTTNTQPINYPGFMKKDNNIRSKQTPVDINLCKTKYDSQLTERPLKLIYAPTVFSYQNNGYSIKFTLEKSSDQDSYSPVLKGGPIDNSQVFRLHEFHMHWGPNDEYGSEHFVDGEAYSGEIHLVHWNSSLYQNAKLASNQPDGLCVIGVFMKSSDSNFTERKKESFLDGSIKKYVEKAISPKYKGVTDKLNITKLLPKELDQYFTYYGSLTTPPFTENVRWIIMRNPVEVSHDFMEKLRELRNTPPDDPESPRYPECCILQNFRNIMPLNQRCISRSYDKLF